MMHQFGGMAAAAAPGAMSGAAFAEIERAKAEDYGFDVLGDDMARPAEAGKARVWFDVENVQILDNRGVVLRVEPRVMMRMQSFSDTQAIHSVPKMPAHERAYPRQWAAFVRGVADTPQGTSIEELPRVSRLTREMLRALGVRTIEEAAELPDAARQALGLEGNRVCEIARAYLAREKEHGPAADQATELAALRAEMQAMAEQNRALALQLAATQQAMQLAGAAGARAAAPTVAVEADPDYSDLPGADVLGGGDVDDDGLETLLADAPVRRGRR